MLDLLETHRALIDASERLAQEHYWLPAGSVIRCFAREVARARKTGTPYLRLVEIAEGRTRTALVRRSALTGSAVAAG